MNWHTQYSSHQPQAALMKVCNRHVILYTSHALLAVSVLEQVDDDDGCQSAGEQLDTACYSSQAWPAQSRLRIWSGDTSTH